eukprot:CAMPEP_0116136420 /NCGR_PEP_ID=MMETSP0329-20121206/11712_1 /TAXON_ID=697910 /ORGANISM="Pseudo-nitzschia arenysensis, Strain B593" /LENGTH=216 /DNA_ID=CAMNT_0003631281 /DNA_START=122 /DNA_END=772 /DNA_ORIENTATION=+
MGDYCHDENDNQQLSQDDFDAVTKLKGDGNGFFKSSKWDEAESSYLAAIDIYQQSNANKTFSGQSQDTLVALYSNLSMVHLKQERFVDAEQMASLCIDLDAGNGKAFYRRAMARLQISRRTPGGDFSRIEKAREDALSFSDQQGDANRKLLQKIQTEAKRIESMERKKLQKQFSTGFDLAVDSGDRQSSSILAPPTTTMQQGGDSCCHTDSAGAVS